ncbi:MAG: hypothetical protein ACK5E6_03560, partial [Cyanobacteriota bacterium]
PGARPDRPWRQILVGDSFSEGWCVPDRDTLAASLQRSHGNTINAGRSGSGPLAQLALLQELAASRSSRQRIGAGTVVIWQLFSGNDAHNLREEKTTRLATALSGSGSGQFDAPQRWQPALRTFLDDLVADAPVQGPGARRHPPGEHGGGETLTGPLAWGSGPPGPGVRALHRHGALPGGATAGAAAGQPSRPAPRADGTLGTGDPQAVPQQRRAAGGD